METWLVVQGLRPPKDGRIQPFFTFNFLAKIKDWQINAIKKWVMTPATTCSVSNESHQKPLNWLKLHNYFYGLVALIFNNVRRLKND